MFAKLGTGEVHPVELLCIFALAPAAQDFFFAILLRMTILMATKSSGGHKYGHSLHGMNPWYKGQSYNRDRFVSPALRGPSFKAGLWRTPICAIGGSRGLESVREIFSDLLYCRQILPCEGLIL